MRQQIMAAKKAFEQGAWQNVLQAYGCTMQKVNPKIFLWSPVEVKKALEDLGYAYGQLSNFRLNRRTKEIENKETVMMAKGQAIRMYTQLLAKSEDNMKGLHGLAYVYYKFVIDFSNQKNLPKEADMSRVENFLEAQKWYDKILVKDAMNIKANYRFGKLYLALLNDWSPSFRVYLQQNHISRRNAQNIARSHFCKVLQAYELLDSQSKKRYVQYQIKTKYNLGNLYLSMGGDNSHKVWDIFAKNPDQPVAGYVAYGYDADIEKALQQYFEIALAYGVNMDAPIAARDLVSPPQKKKYAISPKDVFYRIGCSYALWYRRKCFLYGRKAADQSVAERGVYYYMVSLQYAWWMIKKGYNRHENYNYISKKWNSLCRLANIQSNSNLIQQIKKDIPQYILNPD